MRLLPLALVPLLAGCVGNALDYMRPKTAIVAPELIRYGLDPAQSECVGQRLGSALDQLQLRLLARAAGSVTQGYADPARLTPSDLLWVGTHVKDPKVGPEVAAAAASCGVSGGTAAGPDSAAPPAIATAPDTQAPAAPAPAPPASPGTPQATPVDAGPARPATWVNLGAAATGQAIAVEASSIEKQPTLGMAWFRLTSPGAAAPSNTSYLLRIDCAAKTITTMAHRTHGADGAVEERRDYGPDGAGALPIEPGTVIEIAYLSLCTG